MHGSADGGKKKEREPEIRFFHRKNNETKTHGMIKPIYPVDEFAV